MMQPTLLVLTKQFCFLDKFKFTISKLIGSQYDSSSVLLGHPAVTRSLLDGLRKLEVPFTYNPPMVSVPFDLCVVPCTAQVVLQAINLKRRGLVRKLLVGPNISVRSNEHNGLLASQEVDVCLVPSNWVKKAYIEDEPTLKSRISVWFAGVDEEFWKPNKRIDSKKVLVYCKTGDLELCDETELIVTKSGFTPIRIVYGQYDKETYRTILSECRFSIFISPSESQGIALAESWSMDVPTLVMRAKKNQIISGKLFTDVSSAPYLNKEVGEFWDDREELSFLLTSKRKYKPRSWVLKNMTDEISVNNLIKICEAQLGEKF